VATTIILVRHAAHDLLDRVLVGRQPDVFLSTLGVVQAERLAHALVRSGIAAVNSSPQARARQTAEPIALLLGTPTEIAFEFDETDFGAWTGRTFDSLQDDPAWKRWNSCRDACRPPGGESMDELQSRVLAGLSRLATTHPDQSIAVVTHAEPMRAAVLHCRGLPLREFARVQIDPCSCTTLQVDGDHGSIVQRNTHPDAMMWAS
jgi:broad specificity phosphatase PhoE